MKERRKLKEGRRKEGSCLGKFRRVGRPSSALRMDCASPLASSKPKGSVCLSRRYSQVGMRLSGSVGRSVGRSVYLPPPQLQPKPYLQPKPQSQEPDTPRIASNHPLSQIITNPNPNPNLRNQTRPRIPSNHPLRQVITSCWAHSASDRPAFDQVCVCVCVCVLCGAERERERERERARERETVYVCICVCVCVHV